MEKQILTSPFNFTLLDSDFSNWKYRYINKGDSLVVLRELDLTIVDRLTAVAVGGHHAAHAAVRLADDILGRAAPRHASWKAFDDIFEQAKFEYTKTGKIKGFELLNLRTLEKLWISHYDLNFLSAKP
jgi:hypothetical protein